ncbi:MAG TPA: dUTP diphosphatase [Clostridiales bacterium]|jgi:dUTP pyrophosphatase|nr:dUTP diphosphatase [Clostridiales bacterium]
MQIPIKRLRPVELPMYASEGAAAADLRAAVDEPITILPHTRVLIPTGVAVAVPEGCVALVFARSGLAIRHGLALSNGVGVIDSDYRGEIQVGLYNHGEEPYTVQPGERIAQMAILPFIPADFVETDTLPETRRGKGGFGSTGKE